MNKSVNVTYEEFLEEEIGKLQDDVLFQRGLLESFWTGDVPDNATLDHMVIAKAGRLRLQEKARVCALLGGKT